jgi:hypothetical protein
VESDMFEWDDNDEGGRKLLLLANDDFLGGR